jgi:hypothetical protein
MDKEVNYFLTIKIIWIELSKYWQKIIYQRGHPCPVEFRKGIKLIQILELDHQLVNKLQSYQCNLCQAPIQASLC